MTAKKKRNGQALPAKLVALANKLRRSKPEPAPAPEPPALTVAPFDGTDYHTLSVLLGSCRAELGAAALTQAQWAGLRLAIEAEKIRYYIVYLHGTPVGVCSLCVGYSSQRCAVTGTLEDLYIRPEARGQGAARVLVDHVAGVLAAAGGTALTVCCAACHKPLYAALGFDQEQGTGLVRRV